VSMMILVRVMVMRLVYGIGLVNWRGKDEGF